MPEERAMGLKSAGAATPPSERLRRFLEKLSASGFFGKVVISFQNGHVCDVRIEQTKKLEEL